MALEILTKLVDQAGIFINVLATAGVINSNDPKVTQALRVLQEIRNPLKFTQYVSDRLSKYIVQDLKDVPDLDKNGVINARDLALLLEEGHGVLNELVLQKIISQDDARPWQEVFIALINAIKLPDVQVAGNNFADHKAKIGPQGLQGISTALRTKRHDWESRCAAAEQEASRSERVSDSVWKENRRLQQELREEREKNAGLNQEIGRKDQQLQDISSQPIIREPRAVRYVYSQPMSALDTSNPDEVAQSHHRNRRA